MGSIKEKLNGFSFTPKKLPETSIAQLERLGKQRSAVIRPAGDDRAVTTPLSGATESVWTRTHEPQMQHDLVPTNAQRRQHYRLNQAGHEAEKPCFSFLALAFECLGLSRAQILARVRNLIPSTN